MQNWLVPTFLMWCASRMSVNFQEIKKVEGTDTSLQVSLARLFQKETVNSALRYATFLQLNELPTRVYPKIKWTRDNKHDSLRTSTLYQRRVYSAFARIKRRTMWVVDFNPCLSGHICVQNDTVHWKTASQSETRFINLFTLHWLKGSESGHTGAFLKVLLAKCYLFQVLRRATHVIALMCDTDFSFFFFLFFTCCLHFTHTSTHTKRRSRRQTNRRAGKVDKSPCLHAPVDTSIVSLLFSQTNWPPSLAHKQTHARAHRYTHTRKWIKPFGFYESVRWKVYSHLHDRSPGVRGWRGPEADLNSLSVGITVL